ncbi:hypothetical protein PPL_12553 [Heterostelium album PN500]|uniref:N-acetyltransferase domain-containing protein n=1 Tax=Heterostelium pallidum (strain ATCC 26659 / Pp 5 / PN500) TaxID=670386 RepID=D3BMY0_HETP5|nr:hypothetical protein PPL_12553 [Heterostelium album PN500]EFA77342.1 hypothetical protein PPL_12553 [Heterostelium album PN500]|eukprot:XP_020429471.1 hypothetical protein PPL_12553 [Heterostelium album PN500]
MTADKTFNSYIDLGDLTDKNIGQLKLLNSSVLPVSYDEKFYNKLLQPNGFITKLAYFNDIVVGAVSCRIDQAGNEQSLYIMTFCVLAKYRSLGIGKKLLEFVEQTCKNTYSKITLHVQINSEAIEFYKKYGFTIDSTISNYYRDIEPADLKSSLAGLAIGGVFGYALQRSNVYLPSVIQGQMDFSDFTMLKMFMTAALTSSLSITLLDYERLFKVEHLPVMWKRNLIGGLVMGAGIYLTGACPGTVLAQVGAGLPSAYYTFLGGLAGSALYSYCNSLVEKILPTDTADKKPALDQRLGVPLAKVTIPFATALIAVLAVLEKFVPWTTSSISILQSFQTTRWAPYAAGLVVGLLQIPSYILGKNGLGTSSAYVTMSSKVCSLLETVSSSCYFKKFNSGIRQFYGPALNIGMILGAYYSSQTALVPAAAKLLTHSPLYYFGSGAILLFGARLANGCTSGHGLTGMAKMEIAALFGGGIATCYLLK